jgi:hypothetical protein
MCYRNPLYGLTAGWALVLLVGPGLMGLTLFGRHLARQEQLPEIDNQPDGGIIIRLEVLGLWLPGALIELAQRQAEQPLIRTHEELQRTLEHRHQRNAWYALTVRAHQNDGGFEDLTFIRRPHDDPYHFPEFLDVLAAAEGNPPADSTAD